jgi:hypothetical protein
LKSSWRATLTSSTRTCHSTNRYRSYGHIFGPFPQLSTKCVFISVLNNPMRDSISRPISAQSEIVPLDHVQKIAV